MTFLLVSRDLHCVDWCNAQSTPIDVFWAVHTETHLSKCRLKPHPDNGFNPFFKSGNFMPFVTVQMTKETSGILSGSTKNEFWLAVWIRLLFHFSSLSKIKEKIHTELKCNGGFVNELCRFYWNRLEGKHTRIHRGGWVGVDVCQRAVVQCDPCSDSLSNKDRKDINKWTNNRIAWHFSPPPPTTTSPFHSLSLPPSPSLARNLLPSPCWPLPPSLFSSHVSLLSTFSYPVGICLQTIKQWLTSRLAID